MNNEGSQEEMLVRRKGEANPMALGREHNKQHNSIIHLIEASCHLNGKANIKSILNVARMTNKQQIQIRQIKKKKKTLPKSP